MNLSNAEISDGDTGALVKKPVMREDDAKGAAVRMKPMEMPDIGKQELAVINTETGERVV
jgi:hypothetical protein